jgi:hypothetical protein
MISHAIKKGWAVVDGTADVTTIHQDHHYNHLPGGKPHYKVEESDENRVLAGGKANMGLITDANRRLVNGSLETVRPGLVGLVRKVELWLTPAEVHPDGFRWSLARRLRKLRKRLSQPANN